VLRDCRLKLSKGGLRDTCGQQTKLVVFFFGQQDSSGLTNDEAGDTIAPKLHLVLSYPGENLAPLSGEPTSGTSDGLYNLNFDRKFRCMHQERSTAYSIAGFPTKFCALPTQAGGLTGGPTYPAQFTYDARIA
jgi:hypothetical protein